MSWIENQFREEMDTLENESYQWFNDNIRVLPKTEIGEWNFDTGEFLNNDVDAFRHTYVMARLTDKYGYLATKFVGDRHEQENLDQGGSKSDSNMDLWNNAVGRNIGKIANSIEEIGELVKIALNNGELIITNDQEIDSREYEEPNLIESLKEYLAETNQNIEEFFEDLATKLETTLEDVKNEYNNYLKDYLSNLPVGEAISAILSAQLDFLNAQGLSTRWALHDPLVLDLDGDGIELTNIEDSNTYFDIDGDGIAERTGWVKGDDGILVRDVNGNGKIDVFMIKIAC